MKIIAFLAFTVLLLVGCSSTGFNRGELKKQVGVTKFQINDEQIKEVLKRKSNLPKPFKLGIYLKKPSSAEGKSFRNSVEWKWEESDRETISKSLEQYKKDGMISKIVHIHNNMVQEENLKSIRLAAANYGVDAVLIIDGISDIDRYINKLGWSYALLLPTMFVKGSEVDGLFITTASLWDVRNEFLYLTEEAEGKYHESYIAAFGSKDKEINEKSKSDALSKLGKSVAEMIDGK